MRLYEIDNRVNEILENGFSVDEESGEYWGEEDLDALAMSRNEIIENVSLYVKDLDALTNAVGDEIDALKERQAKLKAKSENIKAWLTRACNGNAFTTAKTAITFRKSTVCEVNEELLPKIWWKQKITESVDKAGLKLALKQGEEIPGAALVEKTNITIK